MSISLENLHRDHMNWRLVYTNLSFAPHHKVKVYIKNMAPSTSCGTVVKQHILTCLPLLLSIFGAFWDIAEPQCGIFVPSMAGLQVPQERSI